MELNYELDIAIDEQALDVEWLQQPDLMRKYAKHAALTRKDMDEAKERLDIGKARLEMEIRSNPETFGLSKVTESAIQSTLLLQLEYQTLSQSFIDAKYEYEVSSAVVRAIDQKKTALEHLVKLLSASYFAGPKAPRDLSYEWAKEVERKGHNKKIRMQRKAKDKGE